MENSVNNLLIEAIRTFGEDSNITIIVNKGDKCGTVIHGNIDNNARAMFACLHQQNEEVSKAMYRILKLNVMNIITNNSPLAEDLLNSIEVSLAELAKKSGVDLEEDTNYEELQ